MAVFDIFLDVAASGRVMAHLLEPPGLGIRFESRVDMERRLAAAIQFHLNWLRSHGEPILAPAEISYRVVDEVPMAGNFESGDDVGFYAPDAVPVGPDEVERYLQIAGYAHDDLSRLVEPRTDAELDWVRDHRTRPIRRIIRHVVAAELWYMSRIIGDPEAHGTPQILQDTSDRIDATENMLERLGIVWPAFQHWARTLTPELRSRIATPAWWTERQGERWTARKMLRRCIEHCREHTRSVEHILEDYRRANTNA